MGETLSNQPEFALQLWTLRELAERDLASTLIQAREIGYDAIEIFGDGPAFFDDMRAALTASNLPSCSAHVPFLALRDESPRIIAGLHAIGCNMAIVPAFAKDLRDTHAKALQLAGDLNRIGEKLHAAGIAFAYHNEDYDFTPLHEGGASLWQTLVDNTEPALVKLQLDIFTATLMGADPIRMMRDHGRRITSLHVCDMRDGKYVPVGQGTLDWPALLSAASHTAAQWLIVEHDAPANPIADAGASLSALKTMMNGK
jgi:sugar phosphate isomerase/epimerase